MANEDEKGAAAEGYKPTTIITIAGGALPELFDHALAKAMANIDDINTEAKAKRKIMIEITLTPEASRQAVEVEVAVKSKLAAAKVAEGVLFVARDRRGEPFAVESNYHQPELLKG